MTAAKFIKFTLVLLIASKYTSCNAQLSVTRSFDKQTKELTVTILNSYDKEVSIIQPSGLRDVTRFDIILITYGKGSTLEEKRIGYDLQSYHFHQDANFRIQSHSSYSAKFDFAEYRNDKKLKELNTRGKITYSILDAEGKTIKMERLKIEDELFDF